MKVVRPPFSKGSYFFNRLPLFNRFQLFYEIEHSILVSVSLLSGPSFLAIWPYKDKQMFFSSAVEHKNVIHDDFQSNSVHEEVSPINIFYFCPTIMSGIDCMQTNVK